MLAKIGFAALVVLVGAESFVGAAAIFWPLTALAHLGRPFEIAAFGLAGIVGVAMAVWMGAVAIRAEKALQEDVRPDAQP